MRLVLGLLLLPLLMQAAQSDRKSFICIFADPKVGNIDGEIKKMVDQTKRSCGVTLVPFTYNISPGYPANPSRLKALAKRKCNASEGLSRFGVRRASALILTGRSGLARSMNDPSGAGEDVSAEFGFEPDPGLVTRTQTRGRFGGIAKAGETAVGILGPGHHDHRWMLAALGQTVMGLPPGDGAGFGIGLDDEGSASGGVGPSSQWTPEGCRRLAENSVTLPQEKFKYNPKQEHYLVPPKQGARLYNLETDRPVFGEPGKAGAKGSKSASAGNNNSAGAARGQNSSTSSTATQAFGSPTQATGGVTSRPGQLRGGAADTAIGTAAGTTTDVSSGATVDDGHDLVKPSSSQLKSSRDRLLNSASSQAKSTAKTLGQSVRGGDSMAGKTQGAAGDAPGIKRVEPPMQNSLDPDFFKPKPSKDVVPDPGGERHRPKNPKIYTE